MTAVIAERFRFVGLHGAAVGDGHGRPAQHDRPTGSGAHAGHIDRFHVSARAMRGQPTVAARAGHRHAHTRVEGLLFARHVRGIGRGLSARRRGRRRLPRLHLRHPLGRPRPDAHIHVAAPQGSGGRQDHRQRRFPGDRR